MPRLAGLTDLKLKQLIWPSLWCFLVLLFLTNRNSPSVVAQENPNSNSSQLPSPSDSLSGKFNEYIDGIITHYTLQETTATSTSIVTANISTSIKAAVIIETRQSGNVIPLVLHFSAVLGPDWPIVIYTSAENFGSFSTSQALLRLRKAGRVVVRSLAKEVWFPNWDSVSWFLTRKMMWEDLAPAEHILIFQSDAILCSNSVRSVEDFFEWDLIGAPIARNWGEGYNGGLSLRKRSTTLRALDKYEWTKYGGMRAEDQWYYHR